MGDGTTVSQVADERAESVAPSADPRVVAVWRSVGSLAASDPPSMGLTAGERPSADVELLASMAACAEYELARRMVLAAAAGGLALTGPGAMLRARGWSPAAARRLRAAGEVAVAFPEVAAQWAAGVITAEHAAAIDRSRGRLTDEQLEVALRGFAGRWGRLGPRAVGEVIAAIESRLYPPAEPDPGEWAAYEGRHLSFSLTGQEVLVSGSLPRLEGEAFVAVIEAFAEVGRSSADLVPAAARRADALMALVESASASGAVPTRGGLPVALTVTLTQTGAGDVLAMTSRGHRLTASEQRFACCDPAVTPVLVDTAEGAGGHADVGACADADTGAARILAIADALLGEHMPLAVGRTARTATAAQRRALAVRDQGCIVPGCGVPAEICQVHHLQEWANGGPTDLDNMVLLCWTHHRQVDLDLWHIHRPPPGAGGVTGPSWPANNASPWTVTRRPRTRWRR
jgi:hypothetical protein